MIKDIRNNPRQRKTHAAHEGRSPQKPGFQARAVATKMLGAVIDQKTSLDGIIDDEHGNPAFRALSDADRALVRAILNSALRHLVWIDDIFDRFLEKPLPEGARHLRHVLAVAAAQILFLDVPDHSAVDIAVEQARSDSRSARFANLVNALLRRLVREKETILVPLQGGLKVFPDWFGKRLLSAYGEERTRAIAENFLTTAPVDLTVKSDPVLWAERLGGEALSTGSVRLRRIDGPIVDLEGFKSGDWWVQDAAASIPAQLLGNIEGMRVADLCAAPGGKTAQLIARGARVTAVEKSSSRMKRLKSNLERLKFSAEELIISALEELDPDKKFDAILLDAPCSSTGTIRRHPDVLWTKSPDDITKLAGVQARLLRSAFTLLAPGGRLVFSNCSLDPEEGEELIGRFLAENSDASRVPVTREDFPALAGFIDEHGDIRTTPADLGGIDGFFAAILQRKPSHRQE